MIKIPSLIEIHPESKTVTLSEFFTDVSVLIDKKFKHIDIFPIKNGTTVFCKHKKSCVHNVVMGVVKGFFKCYALQTIINLVYFFVQMLKKKAFFSGIIWEFFCKKSLNLGLFLAVQNFVMKTTTCFLRYYFEKNTKAQDFLSGFLSGIISFYFLNTSTAQFFLFYSISRLFESFLNFLDKKGILKRNRLNDTIFFAIQTAVTGCAFAMEPAHMSKQLHDLYFKFCTFDYNLLKFKQAWEVIQNKRFGQ